MNIGSKIYQEVKSRKDLTTKNFAQKIGITEAAMHRHCIAFKNLHCIRKTD